MISSAFRDDVVSLRNVFIDVTVIEI